MAEPLLGAPFKQDVREQLRIRSQKRASQNLTDRDLAVQHGSTGWVRVSSGVIIDGKTEPEFKAENNILQGGVLSKIDKGFIESGENGSYTKDDSQGFKPMPGIESVEIVTQNAQGTIRKTDVAFKVNSLKQLEIFERLYLRPGYTLLLEYGHSSYYDNGGNIITEAPSVVDFFNSSKREAIAEKIEQLKVSSNYNYDAILGFGMNFQYAFNMDGGYDCTFYVVSAGSLLESIQLITSGDVKNIKGPTSTSGLEQLENKVALVQQVVKGKKSEPSTMDNTSTALKILNTIYKTAGQRGTQLATLKEDFGGVVFTDADEPYYLHDVSTDIKNGSKKVYINFSTLFKILNNTVNYFTNNKTSPIVKFGFNDKSPINSNFLTYDNHISSNPHVSLLTKKPQNMNLYFGAGDDTQLGSGIGNQIYTDILLDVSFLSSTLGDIADGPKDERTVVDYIKKIFLKVEAALGGINQFDFHYLENIDSGDTIEPATLFIVDRKVTPTSRQINDNIIPCYGKGGLLSNISVTSKISNSIMNMMAIAAQKNATEIDDPGGAVFAFNTGLTDRFKNDIAAQDQTTTDNSSETNEYKDKIKIIEKAVETFVAGRSLQKSEGDNLEQVHSFISKQDIRYAINPNPGLLPFDLSFTMHGIAGLVIGQGFKLQDGILPSYIQDTAGFLVKSINHSIQNNRWSTDISAYMTVSKPDPSITPKLFEKVPLKESTQTKKDNFKDKSA